MNESSGLGKTQDCELLESCVKPEVNKPYISDINIFIMDREPIVVHQYLDFAETQGD